MKVSTRGRYALRLMIDLAQHNDDGYISLKEISARQDITVRYLEQIIAILLKAGFVQSFRGKSGGYRLSRHPREYTTEDILKLTEGSLLPLSCTASQNQKYLFCVSVEGLLLLRKRDEVLRSHSAYGTYAHPIFKYRAAYQTFYQFLFCFTHVNTPFRLS